MSEQFTTAAGDSDDDQVRHVSSSRGDNDAGNGTRVDHAGTEANVNNAADLADEVDADVEAVETGETEVLEAHAEPALSSPVPGGPARPSGTETGRQLSLVGTAAGSQATGDARVDSAVARLSELADLPVAEHVAVFEDIHRRLQEALVTIDDDTSSA
jgi:hypothetical protein